MRPNKRGQVAKFHKSQVEKYPEELSSDLEIIRDDADIRSDIEAWNTCLSFRINNNVSVNEFDVVNIANIDHAGQKTTNNKNDYLQLRDSIKMSLPELCS
jgi:hypothetical protein